MCVCDHRFLRSADWVVVLEDGRIDEQHSGPPATVLPWLLEQQTKQERNRKKRSVGRERERGAGDGKVGGHGDEEVGGDGGGEMGGGGEGGDVRERSTATGCTTLDITVDPLSTAEPMPTGTSASGAGGSSREHALVQEEEKEVGVVAVRVYLAYWAAVGSILAPAIFFALFLMQGTLYTYIAVCFQ